MHQIQNFEEKDNCASTVSVDHTFGSDMNLIGSNMILFGSYMILFGSDLIFLGLKYQVHKPSVLLVVVLINDVKK